MERELWPLLYRAVRQVGSRVRQKGVTYQPWVIALVVLWAAIHDRHVEWACMRQNWSTTRLRPLAWPAPSTISRRAHGVALGLFWRMLEEQLRSTKQCGLLSFVDGKPLVVGGATKDPEARAGRGVGGMAKGYKFHALWSNRCLPEAWDVTPLNAAESVVAQRLVAQAARGGYLLGDGNYHGTTLFDQAARCGYQLVAPYTRPHPGEGHRRQSPHRLRSIALLAGTFGQTLFAQRIHIERAFGNATYFAGGLGSLPAWVRRQHRVRTWLWAKLIINATRIQHRQGLAA